MVDRRWHDQIRKVRGGKVRGGEVRGRLGRARERKGKGWILGFLSAPGQIHPILDAASSPAERDSH